MRARWWTFAADAEITKQETLWLAMCAGNELDTEHSGFAPAAVATGSQQRRFMGEGFEGDFDIGPEDHDSSCSLTCGAGMRQASSSWQSTHSRGWSAQ